MASLSEHDLSTALTIERWKRAAADAVDDIGGRREATDEKPFFYDDPSRCWPGPPGLFYSDTAHLSGIITTDFPKLDPTPLHDIYAAVTAWHADHDAARIPSQPALFTMLERAMLALNTIEHVINARIQSGPVDDLTETPQDGDAMTWQNVLVELDDRRLRGDKFTSQAKMAEAIGGGCKKGQVQKAISKGTAELQEWASKTRGASRKSAAPEMSAIVLGSTPQSRERDPADILEQPDIDAATAYLLEQASPDERGRINAMSPAERRQLAETAYRDPDTEEQAQRKRKRPRRD